MSVQLGGAGSEVAIMSSKTRAFVHASPRCLGGQLIQGHRRNYSAAQKSFSQVSSSKEQTPPAGVNVRVASLAASVLRAAAQLLH